MTVYQFLKENLARLLLTYLIVGALLIMVLRIANQLFAVDDIHSLGQLV